MMNRDLKQQNGDAKNHGSDPLRCHHGCEIPVLGWILPCLITGGYMTGIWLSWLQIITWFLYISLTQKKTPVWMQKLLALNPAAPWIIWLWASLASLLVFSMAPVTQSADSPVENTQWWSSWIILPKFSQHRTPEKSPFCNRITFRTLDLWGPGNSMACTPPSDPEYPIRFH